jgi:hypothetical protein
MKSFLHESMRAPPNSFLEMPAVMPCFFLILIKSRDHAARFTRP